MTKPAELPSILVVDDEAVNIEIMAEILEDKYDVLFATNGSSTLEIVERCNPQLILMDIMMPDINGIELCRKLKANPDTKDIPVIFVTALNHKIDETEGLEAGAIDYVTKPISASVLRARVRNHIELKQLRDQLERVALRDGLTGVANRRSFDETLALELRRARRMQSNLSLIMVDVDFFKQYNDFYGHIEGDHCLKKIVNVFNDCLNRSHDFLARYGGEEFILILPDTELNGAVQLAEKLRTRVLDEKIPHQKSTVSEYVTISLGVLSVKMEQIAEIIESDCERLLSELDKYLYQAKHQGRNRIYHSAD